MSETVECERCGTPGRRRRGFVAPEGWFFGSFTHDSEDDHHPGDFLIVHACSVECRDGLWTQQAGHKWSEIERRVDVPSELRRAAHNEADKLREKARAIRECVYPTGEDSKETAGALFAKLLETAAGDLLNMVESEIDAYSHVDSGAGGA